MTLAEGVETMATDGGHGRKPIAGVDLRSILYFLISRTRWSRCTRTT